MILVDINENSEKGQRLLKLAAELDIPFAIGGYEELSQRLDVDDAILSLHLDDKYQKAVDTMIEKGMYSEFLSYATSRYIESGQYNNATDHIQDNVNDYLANNIENLLVAYNTVKGKLPKKTSIDPKIVNEHRWLVCYSSDVCNVQLLENITIGDDGKVDYDSCDWGDSYEGESVIGEYKGDIVSVMTKASVDGNIPARFLKIYRLEEV